MSLDAMKQALEALEQYTNVVTSVNDPNSWVTVSDGGKPARDAITALRAAIEQTNDWDEVEALRASLREHMAEIHRLRAAIEQAQEPVAWLVQYPNKHEFVWGERPQWIAGAIGIEPLYTTPRQWKELTNEEIEQMMDYWSEDARSAYGGAHRANGEYVYIPDIIRDAEKRLKEKNV